MTRALFAMEAHIAPGLGTFAVDEFWRMYVDPQAVEAWSNDEIAFVWLHECLHLVRNHADSARELAIDESNLLEWNLAADAEINDDLHDLGDYAPGVPVTPDRLGCARGKTAAFYFRSIARAKLSPGDCYPGDVRAHDEGSGVHGVRRSWELGPPREARLVPQSEMIRRAVAADMLAHFRSAGWLPGGLRRWAMLVLGESVDWRAALRSLVRLTTVQVAGRADYSYARLSRRSSTTNVLLPALVRPNLNTSIVVDTSASISDRELGVALAEVRAILREMARLGGQTSLIACDAAADRPVILQALAEVPTALSGGGGTDMAAGIRRAVGSTPPPSFVVLLTDGHTPWPDAPPPCPVVIGLLGDGAEPPPSWARVVHVRDVEASP